MLGELESGIPRDHPIGTFNNVHYGTTLNASIPPNCMDGNRVNSKVSMENGVTQQDYENISAFRRLCQTKLNGDILFTTSDFSLLRWTRAYAGDLETAARKYQRHLRIRKILHLDNVEHWTPVDNGVDNSADIYAPLSICGEIGTIFNGESPMVDNRILLIEKSGKYDLPKIMQSIRVSSFMINRFRIMERILKEIQGAETRSGRPSSAVLIIDLQELVFHSGLVGFLSGPYRIIWGTLIEQYPSLISQIFVINSPTFMNILWNACSKFIPTEYSKKIHLLGENWKDVLKDYIPIESLPIEYGGQRNIIIPDPSSDNIDLSPLDPTPPLELNDMNMESASIPAGSILIHIFYLKGGELLDFFMKHEHSFTMNIFFTHSQKSIANVSEDVENMEEVFAGCERPGGFSQMDYWKWRVPYTGFYHIIFGNEKAWIMSVSMKYQIFQRHPNNGAWIKVNRIPT